MSLIFVSHSAADKPRIKIILDHLIAKGFRLWIDRPWEMGYSEADQQAYIDFIHFGDPWSGAIDEGLRKATCVLLFASTRILDERRGVWHREVVIADHGKKLIAIKIDPVDLGTFGLGVKFRDHQVAEILLPDVPVDFNDEQKLRLNALVRSLEARIQSERTSTYGTFEDNRSSASPTLPTADQIEHYLMLMDRESEADEIVSCPEPLVLVGGNESASPGPFIRSRVPSIELPARLPLSSDTEQRARELEAVHNLQRPHSIKALIVRGEYGDPTDRWRHSHINWPNSEILSDLSRATQQFVEQIVRLPGLNLPIRTPNDTDLSRVAQLRGEIDRLKSCHFVTTTVPLAECADKKRREWSGQLIKQIGGLFRDYPRDHFRFVIQVEPIRARGLLGLPLDPYDWANRAAQSVGLPKALRLPEVRKDDFINWSKIMSLLVNESPMTIESAVATAFTKQQRLPMQVLREHMRPRLAAWPVRASSVVKKARPSGNRSSVQSGSWGDGQI